MEKNRCENCGSKFSRSDNLKRHRGGCGAQNKTETISKTSVERKYDDTINVVKENF